MSREDHIIALARECLDTLFRHQGRLVGKALDCAGVIVHVVKGLGVEYNDVPAYSRRPTGELESVLDNQPCLIAIPKSAIAPGDILLMRFTGEPQHMAVYTGKTIIHAYESIGRCVEHGLDKKWQSRIIKGYRIQ